MLQPATGLRADLTYPGGRRHPGRSALGSLSEMMTCELSQCFRPLRGLCFVHAAADPDDDAVNAVGFLWKRKEKGSKRKRGRSIVTCFSLVPTLQIQSIDRPLTD